MRQALAIGFALWAVHCGEGTPPPDNPAPDAAPPDAAADAATVAMCPSGGEKIRFSRAESCANDGSVEWCIPDNDPQLRAALTQISPTITCAPGGGRAGCYDPPGRLLCFYPTAYPDQCVSVHGAMTDEVWADMCAIAARPEVVEIVATFFE